MREIINRRKEERLNLKGYIADITDQCSVYEGIIEDVSAEGLRLHNVPDTFTAEDRKYHLVISGKPGSVVLFLNLQVTPRWTKKNGLHTDIGFQIINAPSAWKQLVEMMAPMKERNEEEIYSQVIS